jgi:hypothetical protein
MANIQEIIDKVVDTTRRYDRASFIESRVKMAIKHIHALDHWPLDREEIIVPFVDLTLTANDTIGNFPIPLRWRIFETVRPLDSAGNHIGKKFDPVSPMEIEKRASIDKDKDLYYIAGRSVSFKSSVAVSQVLVSYYVTPVLTPVLPDTLADLTTWVTDSWEEAVHDLTCSYVYNQIGSKEIALEYKQTFNTIHEPDIKRSHSYNAVNR